MDQQADNTEMQPNECPDIVLIGHIVKEMIYFPDRILGPVLGSPVSYGSIMAGRLGEKVGIVSIIGTDMPPDLLKVLHDANVDTEGLHIRDGNYTTTTELIYYRSGNKEIRYPQKAPPIGYDEIPVRYRQARVFSVVTMDHDVLLETIQSLRSLPGLLAIDLGGYGGAHSREHPGQFEQASRRHLGELLRHFDIVRASIEDCNLLFGPALLKNESGEAEVVQCFLGWGAKVGLLTLGERGCVLGAAGQVHRIPAQVGQVVDTTGAGDSFFSAFLASYIHSEDAVASARFAAAAVMKVIERTGGAHLERMPTRSDVLARLGA